MKSSKENPKFDLGGKGLILKKRAVSAWMLGREVKAVEKRRLQL